MISVCMATYNGEKYIEEQLRSILGQLGSQDEIIVSDDGSDDSTIEKVKNLNDSRIKVVYNNNTHGYTGNFYNALKYAVGDYIFLSDQDDVWLHNKVEVSMEYLKKYDFIVSDSIEVDSDLNIINESRFEYYNVKKGFINNLCKSRYLGCCMAFNKKVIQSIFPPPTYENTYPHDLWIALIAEKYFKTSLVKQPLILYRRHCNNASNGGVGSERGLLKKITSRLYYVKYVVKQRKIIKAR